MSNLNELPAFSAYAWSTILLATNLVVTWGLSGGFRAKSKTTNNPEDLGTVSKGATLVAQDPEGVTRGLRVFNNAQANIVPWFMAATLFLLLGGPASQANIVFGIFVAARWTHSIVYLAGKQPWRTLSFAIGALCIGATLVLDVVRLVS